MARVKWPGGSPGPQCSKPKSGKPKSGGTDLTPLSVQCTAVQWKVSGKEVKKVPGPRPPP
jgi:hypothetical protein